MDGIQSKSHSIHRISAPTFAAKFNSKREVYMLLTVEAGAYLPAYETLTIYFLKDIISGVKKCKFNYLYL